MSSQLSNYTWLASPQGLAELSAAESQRAEGLSDLKIGEELRKRLDSDRAAMILTQLDLRQRAVTKFSRANEMLFTRAGYEQATSEAIARYRAERFLNKTHVVELCCGIGGDLMALSGLEAEITIVDRDPIHLLLAEFNARVYHSTAKITPLLNDVENVDLHSADAVFIDPARRQSSGRRTMYESQPSLDWSLELASRVNAVGIKTAPGIPTDLIPSGWERELISLENNVKEAVLWSPSLASSSVRATVVNDTNITTLTRVPGEEVRIRNAEPGDWLHDVNPAVTNAGLVEDLARQVNAHRIDREIGFLVTSGPLNHPMLTSWRILDVLPWHEKQIRKAMAAQDIGPIDIRRRGLAGDVPSITKRLRGKRHRRAIIAMTRMQDVPTAIICEVA